MAEPIPLSKVSRHAQAWMTTHFLALLAWIPTLVHAWSMPPGHQYGPMGLTFLAFLLYWTVMMIAMMLPSFSPAFSWYLESLHMEREVTFRPVIRASSFLLGYIFAWFLTGIPIYGLSLASEYLATHSPSLTILGPILLIAVGAYQQTPLARNSLSHCKPGMATGCAIPVTSVGLADVSLGLRNGLYCLGACGGLMLIMLVVGLMNIPWMLGLTALIFCLKTWGQSGRFSVMVGVCLILTGILAFFYPVL
ncbi:DUF2182 domain-containing protein [Ktedonobacter sp. SOSP1-85]|uniref:DUF2182 domain-containing protein n=1 Tax=Ktedonobacter sp. SOSP1-85 TaxID=2778367 RepID=UPI001916125A|nr:DUF2182 domain-containing protein [Ktedonobacter sp. SOSP1-85]